MSKIKENNVKIKKALKNLPSVDDTINKINSSQYDLPFDLIKNIIKSVIKSQRIKILDNNIPKNLNIYIINKIIKKIEQILDLSIKPLINGTGIVLHTGFGRSPISNDIVSNATEILTSYSSLEYNVRESKRGERLLFSKILLNALLESEDSLVVNNCAAAVFISLNTIAFGKDVVISRGQQVEIGGSFRIPEVIKKSGCNMVEVGTTNKTHLRDYKDAINDKTGAILIVHPSNYKVIGFTKDVEITDLVKLAKEKNIPLILDLGSGMIVDNKDQYISNEPVIRNYFKLGVDLVMFSSDKLLGGPQAGIIAGNKKLILNIHKNPLYRSLRCNKFILTLLEQTLCLYKNEIQVYDRNLCLKLLNQSIEDLRKKGSKILSQVNNKIINLHSIELVSSKVEVGSGSLPTEKKDSVAIQFKSKVFTASKISDKLRNLSKPIVGYIKNDIFYIDLKAIFECDLSYISNAISKTLK